MAVSKKQGRLYCAGVCVLDIFGLGCLWCASVLFSLSVGLAVMNILRISHAAGPDFIPLKLGLHMKSGSGRVLRVSRMKCWIAFCIIKSR